MAIKDWVTRRLRRMRWFERRWIPDAEERDDHLRRTSERLTGRQRADVEPAPDQESPQA